MNLKELVDSIPKFFKMTEADRIRFFCWYLHSKKNRLWFKSADIRLCYDELSLEKPADVNVYLHQMLKRRPSEVLRKNSKYSLVKQIRDHLDTKYGQRIATVQVDRLLLELPSKIPNIVERSFLAEAILCFRCKAYRAAIVMTWCLAYDHLCQVLLGSYLPEFKQQWLKTYPNHRRNPHILTIDKRADFEELKEAEVIQVCRASNIITNDVYKILNEKLGKRNTAAHPSTVDIVPHTAEEYIIDLITNCVLKL